MKIRYTCRWEKKASLKISIFKFVGVINLISNSISNKLVSVKNIWLFSYSPVADIFFCNNCPNKVKVNLSEV